MKPGFLTMADPDISIIIPAYNEEKRLPSYLGSVLEYLESSAYSFEVIVVDDGSSDATAACVRTMAQSHPGLALISLEQNQGKGFAIKTGMLNASGARRLFADADGATPIRELERLAATMDAGFDVVIASRAVKGHDCTVKYKVHRKLMGTVFNALVRTLLRLDNSDTQCGFKLMSAEAATSVFQLVRLHGFGFDVEMLYIAHKLGYRVTETAVNWNDIKGSKVSVVKDSLRMLTDILKVRFFDYKGYYGKHHINP